MMHRYLAGNEPHGLVGRVAERFPLGRGMERIDLGDEPPSSADSRPFGLRYLTPLDPDRDTIIDISGVTYCPERQMSILRGEPFILAGTNAMAPSPYDTTEDMVTYPDSEDDPVSDD
ncbi:MAG: hypothetical protein ACRDZ4_24055 [Egibacteraceae bacterium]